MSDELILGAAYNMTFEDLYPFARSLEQTGYDGAIGIVCCGISPATKYALGQMGHYFFKETSLQGMHIANRRWLECKQILNALDSYKKVLITDLRDVVFQLPPFQDIDVENKVLVFQEDGLALNGNSVNKDWFVQYYGAERFLPIAHNRVICAGMIYGSYQEIKWLTNTMCLEMYSNCSEIGVDQAILNMIVHEQQPDWIVKKDNTDGIVLTVAGLDTPVTAYGSDETWANENTGAVYTAIHQYDRRRAIEASVLRGLT